MPASKLNDSPGTGQHGHSPTSKNPTCVPNSWNTVEDCSPEDPAAKINLYIENRTNILKNTHWLTNSEIHSEQMILKRHFPFLNGLRDPAIKGSLVVPANSEFVQIITTGLHWVCLSTIKASTTGSVRIFHSMYQNPNSTAIEHARGMLMHTGDEVTIINDKVQSGWK